MGGEKKNKYCVVLSGQDMNGCDASRLTWSSRLSWSHTLKTQTLTGLVASWPTHRVDVCVCVSTAAYTQQLPLVSRRLYKVEMGLCATKMTVCHFFVFHLKKM